TRPSARTRPARPATPQAAAPRVPPTVRSPHAPGGRTPQPPYPSDPPTGHREPRRQVPRGVVVADLDRLGVRSDPRDQPRKPGAGPDLDEEAGAVGAHRLDALDPPHRLGHAPDHELGHLLRPAVRPP